MTVFLEKTFNTLKDFVVNAYSGTDDPLPANQLHGDRENQQVTVHDGQGVKHHVVETNDTSVNEDSKTSSSHDPSQTLRNDSVKVRRGTLKVDPRPRHSSPTNSHVQTPTLADENTSLKTQLEANRRDLTRATKQSGELERKIQELTSEKEQLQANVKIERDEVLRGKMEAETQIRKLQGKNQKLEEDLKILKGTLRGVQDKHLHTIKLLEERTADLKGAQSFLTTVDRYAGAEIVKMVEALNAEIFQGAALISELLGDAIFTVDEQRKHAQVARDNRDYLVRVIGPELIEHLSTKWEQVQVDPLPLQLAVQAILTHWCVVMVNNFYAGAGSSDLKEIYRRIWESEPQAVAGRWRAMMTGQAKHLDSTTEKDNVVRMLSTLLYISGSSMANVTSQNTGLCLQQVTSTITDMWMQLRTAIQEGVTTTEMQVFGSNANDIYQDAVMHDIYADTGYIQPDLGKRPGHVLCAVGMGLKRSVVRRNGDGTMSVQSDITLKAKVAFPFVFCDSA